MAWVDQAGALNLTSLPPLFIWDSQMVAFQTTFWAPNVGGLPVNAPASGATVTFGVPTLVLEQRGRRQCRRRTSADRLHQQCGVAAPRQNPSRPKPVVADAEVEGSDQGEETSTPAEVLADEKAKGR